MSNGYAENTTTIFTMQNNTSENNYLDTALAEAKAQLAEKEVQLTKLRTRAEYVSIDEANELQDVLRTLAPSGRAFLTSARELVNVYYTLRAENERLAALVAALREEISSHGPEGRNVTNGQHFSECEALRKQIEQLHEAIDNAGSFKFDIHLTEDQIATVNAMASKHETLRGLLERAVSILKKYQSRYHGASHAQKHWEEGAQVVSEIESALEGKL